MTLPAVRTVEETDEYRIVEGLAYPFRSRDTYGTFFSARTDFHWDYFPDVVPASTAKRADEVLAAAKYIRPVNYHHGFEPDFGLSREGGYSPVRVDSDGVWVRAQIDKRSRYYESRLKPLLDSGALGLSGDSAEHNVRIDQRSGEVLEWPAYGLALTPVESNPLAQLATRADPVIRILEEAATRRDISQEERDKIPAADFAGPDKSFPIAKPEDVAAAAASVGRAADSDAVKAKIIAIAKRKGADFEAELPEAWKEPAAAKSGVRAIQTFADIQASAEMNDELPEAFDTLTSAIYGAIWALDADNQPAPPDEKRTAISESLSQFGTFVLDVLDRAGRSAPPAARAGRRNSTSDQAHIDDIHDASVALGATAHAATKSDAGEDDAARSADTQPEIRIVAPEPEPAAVRVDVEAVTQALRPVIADAVKERLEALRSG